jgi:hypothetical protein
VGGRKLEKLSDPLDLAQSSQSHWTSNHIQQGVSSEGCNPPAVALTLCLPLSSDNGTLSLSQRTGLLTAICHPSFLLLNLLPGSTSSPHQHLPIMAISHSDSMAGCLKDPLSVIVTCCQVPRVAQSKNSKFSFNLLPGSSSLT